MKKVIVRHNPSENYPMYLEKLFLEKGNDKFASIGHIFTSCLPQAMIFVDDEYLGVALRLLSLHKKRGNKKYEYSIEEID